MRRQVHTHRQTRAARLAVGRPRLLARSDGRRPVPARGVFPFASHQPLAIAIDQDGVVRSACPQPTAPTLFARDDGCSRLLRLLRRFIPRLCSGPVGMHRSHADDQNGGEGVSGESDHVEPLSAVQGAVAVQLSARSIRSRSLRPGPSSAKQLEGPGEAAAGKAALPALACRSPQVHSIRRPSPRPHRRITAPPACSSSRSPPPPAPAATPPSTPTPRPGRPRRSRRWCGQAPGPVRR